MKLACRHCNEDHKYVCDCGHSHTNHTFSGGCQYENCLCEGYSQRHKRLPDETTKEFNYRIAHPERKRRVYA